MSKKVFSALSIITICLFCHSIFGQTRQGDVLSQEYCKRITEYYCKQYVVDEILNVPDRQGIEVYIDPITAAKSGELTTVLYHCKSLNKRGVVFAFWNDFSTGILPPYKGFGFYNLDLDTATELFNELETLINQDNKVLTYSDGNLVYKFNELTFVFYKSDDFMGNSPIRVWWKTFDSDWTQVNLRTTIKRFRKVFNLTK
jgi:hypothetical protein